MTVHEVYVAAGSNVEPGNRLRRALSEIGKLYGPLIVSPAYRNAAVGFSGDDFINLAIGFMTSDTLTQVRLHLQQVETLCGRPADAPKWAPRAMDLDILLYGSLVLSEPGLIVPRPDLIRRAYMLKPAADIAPDFVHPTQGKTLGELWREFDQRAHTMVAEKL